MNLKGTLSLPTVLPFEKTAQRHDAPLADHDIPIERAAEDRLASRVDCREFRRERGFRLARMEAFNSTAFLVTNSTERAESQQLNFVEQARAA
jgi:hypothetical protein